MVYDATKSSSSEECELELDGTDGQDGTTVING